MIRSFALTRRYAFVSLVGVLITAIVLAILYHSLSIRTIIELGERNNVTVATLALNAVLPELGDYLLVGEDAMGNRAHDHSPNALFGLVRQSLRDTPVDRLKIYDRDGIVRYSTEEREIGTSERLNPRLQAALSGDIRSALLPAGAPRALQLLRAEDMLIETYLPIWESGNPQPIGVFELYTNVAPIVRAMTRNELLVLGAITGIMIVLYALLVVVVLRSERIIARQHEVIHKRNQTLQTLSERMMAAEEDDRRRVAWELHEEIAQTLSAIKTKIEAVTRAAALQPCIDNGQPNEEIVALLQGAIRDVRSLAMDLRPSTLDDFGLSASLGQLCREVEQAVGRPISAPQIAVRDQDVPEPLRGVIFRVVQQTLKHLVARNGVRDLHVSLDRERGQGLRLAVAVSASGDHIDDPRISESWERAVLSGAAYRETRSATGYVRYEATWCLCSGIGAADGGRISALLDPPGGDDPSPLPGSRMDAEVAAGHRRAPAHTAEAETTFGRADRTSGEANAVIRNGEPNTLRVRLQQDR